MKIRNFVARDMRTALRMIRDELGADAVMLSSRATAAGIEVVAATGGTEADLAEAMRRHAAADIPTPPAPRAETPAPVAAAPRAAVADPAAAFAAAFARTPAVEPVAVAAAPAADAHDTLIARARARLRADDGPTLAELSAAIRPAAVAEVARSLPLQRTPSGAPAAPALAANADVAHAAPQRAGFHAVVDDADDAPVSFAALMAAAAPVAPIAASTPAPAAPLTLELVAMERGAERNARAFEDRAVDVPAIEARTVMQHAVVEHDAADRSIAEPVAHAPVDVAKRVAEPAVVAAPLVLVPSPVVEAEAPAMLAMREEMAQMRRLMESQMQQLERERLRGSPARAAAFDALRGFGCDDALAQAVAATLDASLPVDAIRGPMLDALAAQLRTTHAEPIDDGGVIALVGPTGAGKTTTVAKLAARFAARHRARDVALVTTDCERPGAHEQLQAHGRTLGITVCEARGVAGVHHALTQLADYPLVLVDTTGYAPNDRALFNQILWLRSSRKVRSLLVLPANGNPQDMDDVIRRYRPCAPEGLVLTKFDEAGYPGAALSVAVRNEMPIAYTTHGQRADGDILAGDAARIAHALDTTAPAIDSELAPEVRHGVA